MRTRIVVALLTSAITLVCAATPTAASRFGAPWQARVIVDQTLDPNSRFVLRIDAVVGQPGQKNLIFSPRLVDRNYVVKAKLDLTSGSYAPLPNSSFSDNGQERTVTDFDGNVQQKFYTVEITKP